jgi:Tfp pilus assembly protein PilF
MGHRPLRLVVGALSLALLTLVSFLPATDNGFISLDTPTYVLENRAIAGGLTPAGVRWALTSFYGSNWHPLTWLSHMADISLFGLRPAGHHLTSLAVHAASAAFLFAALAVMTGGFWRSLLAAALFALHPLHVESVAWVAERKDVLAGFFFALGLLAYHGYLRRPGTGRYLLLFLLFAAGLMSKPMLVTFPFVLLLLDIWPLGRLSFRLPSTHSPSRLRVIAEKAPLLALSLAGCVVTLLAQRGAMGSLHLYTPWDRISNALVSYFVYLRQTFWPGGLAVYYPYPVNGPPVWQALLAALVLTGVTVGAIRLTRRCPWFGTGWNWYLGMLVPVIGIVQVGSQARADRYTYLPLIGVFVALSWGAAALTGQKASRRVWAGSAAAALVFVMVILTRHQLSFWRDGESLFRHALDVTHDNWLAHGEYGLFLAEQGRLPEAEWQINQAVRINPKSYKILTNLGMVVARQGRLAEAITLWERSLAMKPGYAEPRNNLGVALAMEGRFPEAEAQFRQALRDRPGYPEAVSNLAGVLEKTNRSREAVAAYRELVGLKPEDVEARIKLGAALLTSGDPAGAEEELRRAIAQDPSRGAAFYTLGAILARQGRGAESRLCYERAKSLRDAKVAAGSADAPRFGKSKGYP